MSETQERLGASGWLARAVGYLLIPGILGATITTDYWETTTNALALHAALAAIPLWFVLVALARWLGRAQADRAARFWWTTVVGAITLPLWCITLAYTINATLDSSLRERTLTLERKYESKSGKSSYLSARIAPFGSLEKPVVLGLQQAEFNRLPESGPIRALAGDGYLGYPWIAELELVAAPPQP